jgi:hypothetical protein
MGTETKNLDRILRLRRAKGGLETGEEPIHVRDRVVRCDGSSVRSPVVNLTMQAREELGIVPGDSVSVEVYSDMVVIVPEGSEV